MTLKLSHILVFSLFIYFICGVGFTQAQDDRGVRTIKVTDQSGEEVTLYKKSYALVIGVSQYTNGWPSLPGVKQDVIAVTKALKDHGFEVILLEDPTREQLNNGFTNFINKYCMDVDNRIIIYFAGHGHTVKLTYGDKMGYIVPGDAPNPNVDKNGFLEKAMDMQQIEVYAKRIQSKHVLFLFDSCFSGSIFALSRAVPESISYKTAKPVRQFITSGSADEQVPDKSIFRELFISGLNGEADSNKDGYITGTELSEYLQTKVLNYSKGAQHPQYGKIRNPNLDKGDFVFKITIQAKEVKVVTDTTSKGSDPEVDMWNLAKDSDSIEDLEEYLKAYPSGRFIHPARLKIKQLQRKRAKEAENKVKADSDKKEVAVKKEDSKEAGDWETGDEKAKKEDKDPSDEGNKDSLVEIKSSKSNEEKENNDHPENANELKIGEATKGYITSLQDIDFYKAQLKIGNTYDFIIYRESNKLSLESILVFYQGRISYGDNTINSINDPKVVNGILFINDGYKYFINSFFEQYKKHKEKNTLNELITIWSDTLIFNQFKDKAKVSSFSYTPKQDGFHYFAIWSYGNFSRDKGYKILVKINKGL